MTPIPAVAAVTFVWVAAMLWRLDSDDPGGGRTLVSQETFRTGADCVAAIPRFEAKVIEQFNSRGIVVCVRTVE